MTHAELQEVNIAADRAMKAMNGHRFVTILKTRCSNCGRSPNAKGRCGGWFQTFLTFQTEEMMRRGFIDVRGSTSAAARTADSASEGTP